MKSGQSMMAARYLIFLRSRPSSGFGFFFVILLEIGEMIKYYYSF